MGAIAPPKRLAIFFFFVEPLLFLFFVFLLAFEAHPLVRQKVWRQREGSDAVASLSRAFVVLLMRHEAPVVFLLYVLILLDTERKI